MTRTVGPKSQTELLKDHFVVKDNISGHEARSMYKINALPRRISDLEEEGHRFRRDNRVDQTGQRYVRYFWEGYTPIHDEVVAREAVAA